MVAASEFNRKAGSAEGAVYGVVTTGSAWKFLLLRATEVTIDIREYYIVDLKKIMGIFAHVIQHA